MIEYIKENFNAIKIFLIAKGRAFMVPWAGQQEYWAYRDAKKTN